MLVTAIPNVAEMIGIARILKGKAIAYPFGDPTVSDDEERKYRRDVVEAALRALQTPVSGPTVFHVGQDQ